MKRLFVCALMLLGVAGLWASAPAGAQVATCTLATYPPSTSTLTVNTSTVSPGGSVTVSGTGVAPGATVTLALSDGTGLGTTTADASGNFSRSVVIPTSVASGTYTLSASTLCPTGEAVVLSTSLTVAGTTTVAPPPGGTLPRTGGTVVAQSVAGAALLGVGAVLVIATMRRRSARAEA